MESFEDVNGRIVRALACDCKPASWTHQDPLARATGRPVARLAHPNNLKSQMFPRDVTAGRLPDAELAGEVQVVHEVEAAGVVAVLAVGGLLKVLSGQYCWNDE